MPGETQQSNDCFSIIYDATVRTDNPRLNRIRSIAQCLVCTKELMLGPRDSKNVSSR